MENFKKILEERERKRIEQARKRKEREQRKKILPATPKETVKDLNRISIDKLAKLGQDLKIMEHPSFRWIIRRLKSGRIAPIPEVLEFCKEFYDQIKYD
ncbi:MAG: hypothetical protein ACTSRW_03035 [Candidatus Helarchaeota archaeon]